MTQSAQVALVPASPGPERAAKGCCTRRVLHERHEAWAGANCEPSAAAACLQRAHERFDRPHPRLTRGGGPTEEAAVQATRGAAERAGVNLDGEEAGVFDEDTYLPAWGSSTVVGRFVAGGRRARGCERKQVVLERRERLVVSPSVCHARLNLS
ncbi:hypothetical protein GH5_06830 [Leishmania sp. Ghana 2012 LV757]|uniref:hypothetical protein n=1 Tax=Leishmania sp. Ghana 2012 LV757 TaxID=2803181 RepID=UPI001B7819E8|nr:hypothetical protein GH5_06830 [Leishmania sp. Ghana 2012 LV757]